MTTVDKQMKSRIAEQPAAGKLAYTIDDLIRGGLGSKTFLYAEIRANRLRVRKQGTRTIVTSGDLADYLDSLSRTVSESNPRKPRKRSAQASKIGSPAS